MALISASIHVPGTDLRPEFPEEVLYSGVLPGRRHLRSTFILEGYRVTRRCSRDTYPESYITKYTRIRRLIRDTPGPRDLIWKQILFEFTFLLLSYFRFRRAAEGFPVASPKPQSSMSNPPSPISQTDPLPQALTSHP